MNVLAHDQAQVAQHFARSGLPPLVAWTGIAVREHAELEEQLIDGALAWLACETMGSHPAGNHSIFVGSVRSIELGRDEAGLIYVRGAYVPA